MAKVGARIGLPLMPHQQLIADVAGEVLPDGRMAYPVVVVLMPRRGGKTGLTLPTSIQRAAWIPRGRCWYTAQTGKDAGSTFRDEWVERAELLGPRSIRSRLSNGSEALTVPRTKGKIGVFSPGPRSLHGQDADVVTVDEAWAFDTVRGSELETAIRPAMLTRRQRQLWIISAGGNETSTWLLRWRELGRALTGPDQGLAYFEWHPDVDEHGNVIGDLDSPELWASVHPAVGHTIDLDVLREDYKTFGAAEFRRSYLNVFQTGLADRVLPAIAWEDCADPALAIDPQGWGVRLSWEVTEDRATASVSIAQRLPDGRIGGAVIAHRPDEGTSWVADYVAQAKADHPGLHLVADSVGPSVPVTRDLERRGLMVQQLQTRDVAAASSELLDDVLRRQLVHRGQAVLDQAAARAAKRLMGDGGWAFTRRGSSGDTTPIISLSFAAWSARGHIASAPGVFTAAAS